MKWEPQTQSSHSPTLRVRTSKPLYHKPSFQLLLQRRRHESASEQVKTRTALSTCAIVMSPDQAVSSQVICGFKLCVMSHITFVKSSCHRFFEYKRILPSLCRKFVWEWGCEIFWGTDITSEICLEDYNTPFLNAVDLINNESNAVSLMQFTCQHVPPLEGSKQNLWTQIHQLVLSFLLCRIMFLSLSLTYAAHSLHRESGDLNLHQSKQSVFILW